MTRSLFLAELRAGLSGIPADERNDIMADYEAYFVEGAAAGRSDADVEAALGDPARLAKELRAEAGLKSWEENRNPKTFIRAGWALIGLGTLDVLMLPLVFVGVIVLGALIFAFSIVGFVGFSIAASAFHAGIAAPAMVLAGVGLVCTAVGAAALILILLGLGMKIFGGYARLHYRLLDKNNG